MNSQQDRREGQGVRVCANESRPAAGADLTGALSIRHPEGKATGPAAHAGTGGAPCLGRDTTCPCQDGDPCHYRPYGDSPAWPIPESEHRDGWIALTGHIVGTAFDWSTCYDWDGKFYPEKQHAIDAGIASTSSDDFNLGHVVDDTLVWFGWMDTQHPEEDYADVAAQFGWTVPNA